MAFTKIVGAGIHTLSNVHTHNINSSGIITATSFVGPFNGSDGDFSGNVTIDGNLIVNGDTTTLNTTLREVELLRVDANSSTAAGIITQRGSGDILSVYDTSTEVFKIADGGNTSVASDKSFIIGTNSSSQYNIDFKQNSSNNRNTIDGYYLDFKTADLQIRNESNNQFLGYFWPGEVALYASGGKKFSTVGSGIKVHTVGDGHGIILDNTTYRNNITAESNRPGAVNSILEIDGKWNNTQVAFMTLSTGDDTTNKDDGRIRFFTKPSGGTIAERLRIEPDGQIGIGTDVAETQKLTIHGDSNYQAGIKLKQAGINQFRIMAEGGTGNVYYDVYGISGGANGDHIFRTKTSVGSVEALRINENGSVGIGTDNPSAQSTGANNLVVADFGGEGGITIKTNSSSTGNIFFADTAGTATGRIGYGHGATDAGDYMRFYVNSVERLRIDANGHLHTGYTSSFGSDHVNILATDGGGISIAQNNSGNATSGTVLGSLSIQGYLNTQTHANAEVKISGIAAANHTGSSAATDMVFYTKPSATGPGSAPTERLRIRSDGNVDINGTPPWTVSGGDFRSLSISGNSQSTSGFIYLGNSTATNNADFDLGRIRIHNGATEVAMISGTTDTSANDDGRLEFNTRNTGGTLQERVRIDSDGQVQIGSGTIHGGGHLTIRGGGVNTYACQDYQYVGTPSNNTTTLAQLRFTANTTGASVVQGAKIQAVSDAAWSATGDAPTRLEFYTAADGSASLGRKFWIDSNAAYLQGLNHTSLQVRSGTGNVIGVLQTVQDTEVRMGCNTNHPLAIYAGGLEKVRITSTGEIKQYGFTGTSDTSADDLVLGNTTDGVNRGITIWSHSSQNGTLVFADNDSNFRGAVQYIHNGDRMRFLTAGNSILEIKDGQVMCSSDESFSSTALHSNGNASLIARGDTGAWALKLLCRHSQNDYAYLGFASQDGSENLCSIYAYKAGTSSGDMSFGTCNSNNSATERLRIKHTGNIGVGNWGTANIPQTLSIKGNMYFRQGDYITWNNGDNKISGVSGYHLSFETYDNVNSNATKQRFKIEGGQWSRLYGRNRFDQEQPLVNTTGSIAHPDITTNSKSNLGTGWYTIAVNGGNRATGRFSLIDRAGSRHSSYTFYASHHYGGARAQNAINVMHAGGRHSGNPLQGIRIKAHGTYDGAMLQVYIGDSSNAVMATLDGANFNTNGWVMKDWIADGTDPGGLANWSSINSSGSEAAYSMLTQINNGGMSCDGNLIPGFDNSDSHLGTSSRRWVRVYAGDSSINTSDENLKQDITTLTTAEMNAAKRLSKLFVTYKWKKSVSEKGDKARTHTGIIAQRVKAEMVAAGLDPTKYSFYCEDDKYTMPDGTEVNLEDENITDAEVVSDGHVPSYVQPAGSTKSTVYSICYTELLAFIAAYNEQRFTSIEARLAALESS